MNNANNTVNLKQMFPDVPVKYLRQIDAAREAYAKAAAAYAMAEANHMISYVNDRQTSTDLSDTTLRLADEMRAAQAAMADARIALTQVV